MKLEKIKKIFKENKKKVIGILIFLVLALIMISFLNKNETAQEEEKKREVEVYSYVSGDEKKLEFVGTVQSAQSVDLIPEAGGKVVSILVEEGQKVKKGQIIARLESAQENLAYQRALTNLESQRINLQKLENEFNQEDSSTYAQLTSQQEKNVKNAYQAFLNNDLRAYPDDKNPESVDAVPPTISGTYQGVEEGQYKIEMYRSAASSGYSIRVSGLETGIYSASTQFPTPLGEKGLYLQFPSNAQLKEQSWIIDIPNKRSSTYLTSKNAYEATLAGKNLTLTQSKVTQGDLAQQKNTVRQMEIAVSEANLQLERKIIRAPFDGELAYLTPKVGDMVNPGQVIGSIKNQTNLEIEFFVSSSESRFLSYDSKMYLGEEEIGSLYFIGSSIDASGKVKVRGTINNDQKINVGEIISVKVDAIGAQNIVDGVFIIPLTAIQMRGNQSNLLTLDGQNKAKFIPVETGLLLGDMIEVKVQEVPNNVVLDARGIREGETLIIK